MINRLFRFLIQNVRVISYYSKRESFYLVFIRVIIIRLDSFYTKYKKYLSLCIRKKDAPITAKLFEDSVVIIDNFDEGISLDLYFCGIRERGSINYLLSRINRFDIFYDIGANLGYYTVIIAKKADKVIS